MFQFIYKLEVTERVKTKCERHPRYNPERDGRGGIKGGCSTCFSLYDLHQARLALDSAHREFLRKAIPWTRSTKPRSKAEKNGKHRRSSGPLAPKDCQSRIAHQGGRQAPVPCPCTPPFRRTSQRPRRWTGQKRRFAACSQRPKRRALRCRRSQ